MIVAAIMLALAWVGTTIGFVGGPATASVDPGGARGWAPSTYDARGGLELSGEWLNASGTTVADANGLTFYDNNMTRTEPLYYPEWLWGTYPLYLPGSQVHAVITVRNRNLQLGPSGYLGLGIEAFPLTTEGYEPEEPLLPIEGHELHIPKGGELQIPVTFRVPDEAKGLVVLRAGLVLDPGRLPTTPDQGAGALSRPILQINMVFCPPSA